MTIDVTDITVEQAINQFITHLPNHQQLWLAYSGGVDSHVLLHGLHHALAKHATLTLHAIHINHQLQPHASQWQHHCQHVCQALAIDYHSDTLTIIADARQSLEAVARHKRYQALQCYLNDGDYLITAHHQNDQAETLLLQLLRGAGPQGLAAMPMLTSFSPGYLSRPLLAVSRNAILHYAKNHQLNWIEDDSNQSRQFDRNFLRHELFPQILQRYPAAYRTLTRSAALCAESSELLTALASIDLTATHITGSTDLSTEKVKTLSRPRQRNVIRYWLTQNQVPLPSAIKLQHILQDVIHSRYDARPCVTVARASIKRQKDRLFIDDTLPR